MNSPARKPRRGQAMVEFALIAPLFFFLLFAIIEGGRFVFYYEMLSSATREGARYAIIHGSNAADGCPSGPVPVGVTACDPSGAKVKEAVRMAALGLAGSGDFSSLEVFWCKAEAAKPCPGAELTNVRGNPVTVRAVYAYKPVMPLLPPISIGSESTLVINN